VAKPENEKAHKKKLGALRGDLKTLNERIAAIQRLSDSVGGMVDEDEAQELILKKHHDLVTSELEKYLAQEQRDTVFTFSNLAEKYRVSKSLIESNLDETNQALSDFITKLNYLS
jgi:type I restriction enzyme M protein